MSNVGSVELWAAAKVIGRECATVNKEFLLCKKYEGENPNACLKKGELAIACGTNMVNTAKSKFPVEFNAFVKCLDYNDYRIHDCKKEERAFLDCWNKQTNP